VAFDQEEAGLLGSTHFVNHPPHPIRQVKAFVVADMLGRSMANVMDDYVFVLGSETAPRMRALVDEMKPEKGLNPQKFALSEKSRELVQDAANKLDGVLKAGKVTAEDRNWLLWTGRLLLATVF
jgi:Zn-dependent M28 family amino/carboxypeptidase